MSSLRRVVLGSGSLCARVHQPLVRALRPIPFRSQTPHASASFEHLLSWRGSSAPQRRDKSLALHSIPHAFRIHCQFQSQNLPKGASGALRNHSSAEHTVSITLNASSRRFECLHLLEEIVVILGLCSIVISRERSEDGQGKRTSF
jgi:hypothetical protein